MTARQPVRRAALGVVVLVALAGCGVRPEASPRVLDGADATPRLPVPTVSQQPAPPGACPPSPSPTSAPSRTPAPSPSPSPSPSPAPDC